MDASRASYLRNGCPALKVDRRPGRDLGFITITVDHVYRDVVRPAGKREALHAGRTLRLRTSSCYGPLKMGFRTGTTYLVSTREFLAPRGGLFTGWTVAWELTGDRARFVDEMYGTGGLDDLWPGFADAGTVDQALALVAPDVPATDAAPEAALRRTSAWWMDLVLGASFVLGLLAFLRRRSPCTRGV